MNFSKIDHTDKVECFCIIKTIDKKSTVKGDFYLDFNIGDKTGEMNAKIWGYTPSEHGEYAAGDIVKVRGNIVDYKGTKQLRVERMRHVLDTDNVNVEDLVRSAAFGSEQMYNTLLSLAEGFTDNDIKRLVLAIYGDYREKLLYWPAAFKLHHALRGGLLMHTLSIVRLCEAVCAIYPFLDRELLIAGAMLHDIAKTEEYLVNEAGTADGYSVNGNLLGHISMGAEIVGKYAERLEINKQTETLIKHMILSHHGLPEYGAAVKPMIMEAEILSELDLMDSRLYEMKEAVEKVDKGSFTPPIWAIDNLKFFNHARKETNKEPNIL